MSGKKKVVKKASIKKQSRGDSERLIGALEECEDELSKLGARFVALNSELKQLRDQLCEVGSCEVNSSAVPNATTFWCNHCKRFGEGSCDDIEMALGPICNDCASILSHENLRVFITGDLCHDWPHNVDYYVFRALDVLNASDVTVAHGGVGPVDRAVHTWASPSPNRIYEFIPDWLESGAAAGCDRNERVLNEFKPDLIIILVRRNIESSDVEDFEHMALDNNIKFFKIYV